MPYYTPWAFFRLTTHDMGGALQSCAALVSNDAFVKQTADTVFSMYDEDESGELAASELSNALHSFSEALGKDPDEVQELAQQAITECDHDHDGTLDKEEFENVCLHLSYLIQGKEYEEEHHDEEPDVAEDEDDTTTAGAAAAVASSGGGAPAEFAAALKLTNKLRAQHGASPLSWDDTVASHAQEAVDEMVEQESMHHNHSQEYSEGQNIAYGTEGYMDPKKAVQMWYDEVNDPGYSGDGDMGAGHFTQLVWKSTTKVGMAMGEAGGDVYIAANYDPAGNMMGDYDNNVEA